MLPKEITFLLINPSLQSNINLGLDVIEEVLQSIGVHVDRYDLLFSDEKKGLRNRYDFVGVSFITPMNFFNLYKVKHLLKRGRIKIAGGAGVSNPLPINKFFDIFVIGEGEKPLRKIIKCYTTAYHMNNKKLFLSICTSIPSVYVSTFYKKV